MAVTPADTAFEDPKEEDVIIAELAARASV
jgi:hypothetical protein